MSKLSTHILDTARGRPATNVPVTLEIRTGANQWKTLGSGATNNDGRIANLLGEEKLERGTYRLTFDTVTYFRTTNTKSFYGIIPIQFDIDDPTQHYHVPLLLGPFGYSTYRGS